MGIWDKIIPAPIRSMFASKSESTGIPQGFKTFTEYAPLFSTWEGSLYEQAKTRAIIECIAVACSKLKPEFVTPEGSGGASPRLQRLFRSWPNEMMSWPDFIRRVITLLLVDTTAYVVPGYDIDGKISSLYPLKPDYAEVVEYDGEPWIRFHLITGDVQAYPFYDVAILTRFQLDSDVFGGGNVPLTPTLRLMDAQRQAEEIALKNGANIRFIGKLSGMVHEKDMEAKRNRFADSNLGSKNKSGLMVYDQTFEDISQIKNESYTANAAEMERIDKALYEYFTINEKILTGSFTEAEWASFYELCIEPKAIMLGSALTKMLLTATQVRKGNHIMFSSGYLEYSTPDAKVKVVGAMLDRGVYTVNESRDVLQLNRIEGGDVRMIRGEYYMIDDKNRIIAESGGRTEHQVEQEPDDLSDLDEPEPEDTDDVELAIRKYVAKLIDNRLSGVNP